MGHTYGTHTQSSLFPTSGDEVLCFQIYSRRWISYQIVASPIAYVFTSKSEACSFFTQALCSVLWPKVVPPYLKKKPAKTLFTTQLSDSVMANVKQFQSKA